MAKKPPTQKRAIKKDTTRRKIVTAALALFQSRGFDATTTKMIAKRAGIAEGTVFNYFPTKDDIALYFFGLELDHAIATVRANKRLQRAPLEEKLFALVESQLEYLAPYERFIGAALLHALRPGSKLGPFGGESMELNHRYLAFVSELVESSMPRRHRSPLAAWIPQALWTFYFVVILYWLNDSSAGKQHTLAFLDRSLKIGVGILLPDGRR